VTNIKSTGDFFLIGLGSLLLSFVALVAWFWRADYI